MGSNPGSIRGIVDQQNLVLDTALAYLAAGIVPVVVTHPSEQHVAAGKAPRQPGWQRVAPSPAIVRSWFAKPSNLGVLCGKRSGFVCIDVDPRNGGMSWLIENDHHFGYHLRENTGSGGYHLYYRYPEGVEHVPSLTGQDGLAPGVELKADGGHQVVTWPSQHPSGGEYEFAHGLSLLDLETEADELPAWILEAALARSSAPVAIETAERTEVGFTDSEQDLDRAKGALEKWVGVVTQGGRNHAAYKVGWIGKLHGLSPKVWWPIALDWNSQCQPPLELAELRHAVASGYKYTKSRTGENSVLADFPDAVEEPATLEASEAEAQAEELGIGKYPHTNPIKSSFKFLATLHGYFFAGQENHVYEEDTWKIVEAADLESDVHNAIVASNPDVNLKDKHVREIYVAMKRSRRVKNQAYDVWTDGRPGDFIRLENGIMDLNKVELLPHSKRWISCTKLPFAYDPEARCPTFESFLASIWGKTPDQVDVMQQWFGYLLSSRTEKQKFAFLHGESRGGKGTLLKLMAALVGDGNYVSLEVNSLGSRFGLAGAIGKKLLLIPDAHRGTKEAADYAAERIKLITGEDPVAVERKNVNIQTLRLKTKIVMAANKIPSLVDIRGSIFNRMLLFNFTESFAGREDDQLEPKLMRELPGIFNWALVGLERLNQTGKLVSPPSAEELLGSFRRSLNPMDSFFEDCIEYVAAEKPDEPALLYVDDAYQEYRKWCDANGQGKTSKAKFSTALQIQFSKHADVVKGKTAQSRSGSPRLTYYTCLRLNPIASVEEHSRDFAHSDDGDDEFF